MTIRVTHEGIEVLRARHDLAGGGAQFVHDFDRQAEARRKVFHLVAFLVVGQLVEIDLDEMDLEIIAPLRAFAGRGPLRASPLYQLVRDALESEPEQGQ